MMQVEWEYFPDNVSTDCTVAVLRNKRSKRVILTVAETRDCHVPCLTPAYSFLSLSPVSYLVEAEIVKKNYDEASLSTHEILTLRLKEGCKLIEEQLFRRVNDIAEKIM